MKSKTAIISLVTAIALVVPLITVQPANAAVKCTSESKNAYTKQVFGDETRSAIIYVRATIKFDNCTNGTSKVNRLLVSLKQGEINGKKPWTCKRAGIKTIRINPDLFAGKNYGAKDIKCSTKVVPEKYFTVANYSYGGKRVKHSNTEHICQKLNVNFDLAQIRDDGKPDDRSVNLPGVCAK